MGLSRKHKKELKKLRKSAEAVWAEQQSVLAHAASVLADSKKSAAKYAEKDLVPKVKDVYQGRVLPAYQGGVDFVDNKVVGARDTVVTRVIPGVAAVFGTAATVMEAAKDAKNRSKLGEISKARWEELTTPPKKKSGVGTVFAIGAAVVAVAGIGYAVYQTFRADDELWVAEDEPVTPATPAA